MSIGAFKGKSATRAVGDSGNQLPWLAVGDFDMRSCFVGEAGELDYCYFIGEEVLPVL